MRKNSSRRKIALLVENLLAKLKQFRGMASWFEKLVRNIGYGFYCFFF
ncbi:hypothetical protein [Legionella busanensis]|nr:hypothetical protein [Legionella busanensis]